MQQPWYDLEIIEQYLFFPPKQYNQSDSLILKF